MNFNKVQRKIINSKPNGANLIKGITGSGKTTAAINKIPSLLRNYCVDKDYRVVVVTLSESNMENISSIYTSIKEERYHQRSFFEKDNNDKLEFKTLNSLTLYYLKQYEKSHKLQLNIASEKECENLIKGAIEEVAKVYKKIKFINVDFIDFIKDEIRFIKSCNYGNLNEYQISDRLGKDPRNYVSPKILRKNSKQRQAIYEVLKKYNEKLKKINKIDCDDIVLIALKEAAKKRSTKYTHIIIDESQDFTKAQLEFLRTIYRDKKYSSITFIFNTELSNYRYSWFAKKRSFNTLGYDMKGKSINLNKISDTIEKTLSKSKINKKPKSSKKIKENTLVENNKKLYLRNLIDESLLDSKGLIETPSLIDEKLSINKDVVAVKERKVKVENKKLLNFEPIEYIDLKRNVSHKFINDMSSMDEIYTDYDEFKDKVEDIVEIPVFTEIAAGSPILINESYEDNYYLPKDWVRNSKDIFMLKIKGDSMINKNIDDGDHVLIKKQSFASVGDIVAVDIEGEATLKTYKTKHGEVLLMPENEKYDPIVITGDEQFGIIGVAIGVVKN